METSGAIQALGALAHEHRLAVYRLLIERGPEGLSAGDIAARVGLVPSSLTFHVQALQRARLINRRRMGRQLFYAADFAVMNELLGYLSRNCCGQGAGASCVPACVTQPGLRPRGSRKVA
jgi:DNA-binding transcriptional ArsR family regulator